MMPVDSMYLVAIDIGGTFTDCAVMDRQGRVVCMSKSPSTRPDASDGVLGAIAVAAEELRLSLEGFLRQTRLLIHGCTVATNAMIERKGALTGLITTRGHEDSIFIGKVVQKVAGLSEREIIHQSRLSKASPPIVKPEHVIGVRERMDTYGEVVAPLVVSDVEAAVQRLVDEGVECLAVSFLWSPVNDTHERTVRQMIAERYPDLYVQISSEVAPIIGEYERTVTTALSAYLGPPVLRYLGRLAERLKDAGYAHELLISHCRGGLTTTAEVRERPLLTLDSGPAGGVLGARYFGQVYGEANILCTDMGGTSFDVSLIEGGEFSLEEEPVLDKYTFLVPKIAIASIGAGGGSIVWVDPDGILRVGPQSAGADPGPACFGHGGRHPTVTDVDLVLGYLNPANYLGGRQTLVPELAQEALARVAAEAGMDPITATRGAFQIVNAQMADLIRKTTVERGYDPRAFILFAFGGAAPTHAAYYARELGLKRIYVPRYSTVFSALGMLTGGIVHTMEASYPATLPLAQQGEAEIGQLYQGLESKVLGQFRREGYDTGIRIRRFAYVKYRLQPRALAVEIPQDLPTGAISSDLLGRFQRQYADIYGEGAGYRPAGIEIVKVRVDGTLDTVTPDIAAEEIRAGADASAALCGERDVYFVESGAYLPTAIYDGDAMRYGYVLTGPCIVERMGDTIVIPPSVTGEVDKFQSLIINFQKVESQAAGEKARLDVGGRV